MQDGVRRAIRIALSGIARAKAKFGKQLVSAMLGGSHAAKVTRWKLDQLSTFGLLDYLTQVEIAKLIDAMIDAGLVLQNEVDRFRPVIDLTELGVATMLEDSADVSIHLHPALVRKIVLHEKRLDRQRDAQQRDAPAPEDADNSAAAAAAAVTETTVTVAARCPNGRDAQDTPRCRT